MLAPKTLQFNPDGSVAFEYQQIPGDIRDNGMMQSRYLLVPADLPELADEMAYVMESAQRALVKAKEHYAETQAVDPMDLEQRPEFDDPISPWDNPEEREGIDGA